ncbi:GntP family permease [Sporolactobacillus sp. KGMB 08714]|uniref:GntP family permease n=1 Tax=Sporolactobacillus sp. KGMB 08714 TaxID=3064704 RepID=UPI002FBE986A
MSEIISIIVIVVALFFLCYLMMKGANIFVVAIGASLLMAIGGGLNIYSALKVSYMTGFVDFIKNNFLIFVAGALMGKAYEITNGAKSVANLVIKGVGPKKAVLALPLIIGLMTYSGVVGFVVAFAVYPIVLEVFRKADLTRKLIPAVIIFGACTFSGFGPGNPQPTNVVIMNALHTSLMSGATIGFIALAITLVTGELFLNLMIKRSKRRGEHFVARETDITDEDARMPNGWLALFPLVLTLVVINIKIHGENIIPVEYGLALGAVLAYILMRKYHSDKVSVMSHVGQAFWSAISSISNTSAMVAVGTVAAATVGFPLLIQGITSIPGPKLASVAVATNVLAAVAGGATGGVGLAAPILGKIYASTVSLGVLHRMMLIASFGCGLLPYNGFVVTVINGICKDTHKGTYGAVFLLGPLNIFITTVVSVILFSLFPALP